MDYIRLGTLNLGGPIKRDRAWFYTGGPRPYGYLGLGELFVFVFFGLVATIGTTFVAIEHVPWIAWPAATGVGLLACALLVINNLRDIPTDVDVGKRTLAVRLGDARTRVLYVALIVGALAAVVVAAVDRPWSLVALGTVPVAVPLEKSIPVPPTIKSLF